jgi:hypothetical protein
MSTRSQRCRLLVCLTAIGSPIAILSLQNTASLRSCMAPRHRYWRSKYLSGGVCVISKVPSGSMRP